MSQHPTIQRLEALLDRVRRRSSEPRRAPAAPASAAVSAASPPPAPAPVAAPPPPVAVVPPPAAAAAAPAPAPAATAPPPAYAFSAPEPVAYEAPPPPPVAPVEAASASYSASELEVVDTPPPEQLGYDDVIDEIPSDMLESVPPSGGVSAAASFRDEEEDEEEPPISSQRPRAMMELDDPLSGSDAEPLLDEGREVPLKTPPPESGPQAAPMPAGIAAPSSPDVDALLEADLLPPPRSAVSGPTPEQLGQTIDLEEARGPTLELAASPPTPAPPAPPEELEIALPPREAAGRYDEELVPPVEARSELEAHREQAPSQAGETASDLAEAQARGSSFEEEVTAGSEVEIIGRPPLESGTVVRALRAPAPIARPNTFLELLDASITLGG